MIGYAQLALKALEAAGWLTKLLIVLGLAGSLLTAYGVWHHKVYQSGVADTIAGIAREDRRFVDAARKARAKWQECSEQNRGWDQTTGRCL